MRLTDINPVKKKDVKRRVSGILASMNTESVFPTPPGIAPGAEEGCGVFGGKYSSEDSLEGNPWRRKNREEPDIKGGTSAP